MRQLPWLITTSCLISQFQISGSKSETLGRGFKLTAEDLDTRPRVWAWIWGLQFVIFNPWKVLWNWIAFSQNSFVISSGMLYHLIRPDGGRLANEAFTSNPVVSVVSLKQQLNGLKITNWLVYKFSTEVLGIRYPVTEGFIKSGP